MNRRGFEYRQEIRTQVLDRRRHRRVLGSQVDEAGQSIGSESDTDGVILFVIERSVVRIGRDCRRAHVFGDSLWVVQYLDLHGVVVTLFSAVRGAVVVLVPNLIPAVASERHHGKRNDCPVLAHKPVARGDDTGCVEYLEHLRDLRKQSTLRWFGRTLLALIDAVVGIKGNP